MNCSLNNTSGFVKLFEETEFLKNSATDISGNYIPINTFSVGLSQNLVDSGTLTGGREASKPSLGNIEVNGDLVAPLSSHKGTADMLFGLFGNVDISNGYLSNGAPAIERKYSISSSCLPSFQSVKGFIGAPFVSVIAGMKVNTLSFKIGDEGQIDGTFGIIAAKQYDTLNPGFTGGAEVNTDIGPEQTTIPVTVPYKDAEKLKKTRSLIIKTFVTRVGNAFPESESSLAKGSTKIPIDMPSQPYCKVGDIISIGNFYTTIKNLDYAWIEITDPIPYDMYLEVGRPINMMFGGVDIVNINIDIPPSGNPDDPIQAEITTSVPVVTIERGPVYMDTQDGKTKIIVYENVEIEPFEKFMNTSVTIRSIRGSEIAFAESIDFSFENGLEGIRNVNSKGSFAEISAGVAKISLKATLLLNTKAWEMLKDAKLQKDIDIEIKLENAAGETLEFIMPRGVITPADFKIEAPGVVKVELEYKPFSDGSLTSITAILKTMQQ